jgi:serine phosphatase RsbU (regulator of sigma subunit)
LHRKAPRLELLNPGSKKKGLAGGMIPDAHYETEEALLAVGDSLLLYTDGLSDFEDETGTRSDAEVCQELITEHAALSGFPLLDAIIEQARERVHGESFADDICVATFQLNHLAS